mmetsp:Transcript_23323/g.50516  ORF Transcript_23323/g.50516 Transcript_23323/m.50516 type:complete len:357 (-) Transcript_23323:500-1570(-)
MNTLAQQKAVAVAPKFTAAASAISSITTIFLIVCCRGRKKRTYHRIILGMSMCDLVASVAWFFTTWPIPRGTPGVYGAVGNQKTCSAQAFVAQFSISGVMYNASLTIYFVLVIVKNWKDDDIVKIEPLLHANAIAWGLGTALASLSLTLFNPVSWDCWISAAPLGCQESWNSHDGTTTCVRGDNGSIYQWAFYYAPLWFVIVLVSCLMYWVYYTVRAQDRRMRRYHPPAPAVTNLTLQVRRASVTHQVRRASMDSLSVAEPSNHKRIAAQATSYVGAFFITWLFPTVYQLVIVTTQTFPFSLLFLTAFFVPLQGLFNLIVFSQPCYIKYRRTNPDQFFLGAWLRMMRQELGKRSSQ